MDADKFEVGDFEVRCQRLYEDQAWYYYTTIYRLVEKKKGVFRKRTVRSWVLLDRKWNVLGKSGESPDYEWAEKVIKRIRSLDVEN